MGAHAPVSRTSAPIRAPRSCRVRRATHQPPRPGSTPLATPWSPRPPTPRARATPTPRLRTGRAPPPGVVRPLRRRRRPPPCRVRDPPRPRAARGRANPARPWPTSTTASYSRRLPVRGRRRPVTRASPPGSVPTTAPVRPGPARRRVRPSGPAARPPRRAGPADRWRGRSPRRRSLRSSPITRRGCAMLPQIDLRATTEQEVLPRSRSGPG